MGIEIEIADKALEQAMVQVAKLQAREVVLRVTVDLLWAAVEAYVPDGLEMDACRAQVMAARGGV